MQKTDFFVGLEVFVHGQRARINEISHEKSAVEVEYYPGAGDRVGRDWVAMNTCQPTNGSLKGIGEIKRRVNVGDYVERVGSAKDYTTGRRGTVVEIDGERARVKWTHYQDRDNNGARIDKYNPMEPIRTWVNFKFLSDPIRG